MLADLKNITLNVGAVVLNPFFITNNITPGSEESSSQYKGVCFDILSVLAAALNFNYKIEITKSGGRLVNGTWSAGIISSVSQGEFDIGLETVTMSYERYQAVDFMIPFINDKASILSPEPVPKKTTLAIVNVFSPEVWLLTSFAIAMFGPVMKVVENIRFRCHPHLPSTEKKTLWNYVWDAICIALLKDFNSPSGSAPRIVILFWCFMMMVVITMYSGCLLSLLSNPSYTKPINSMADLVNSKLRWGAFPNSQTRAFFQNNSNQPFKRINEGFEEWSLMPKGVDEAKQFLRRGDYALISDEVIFAEIRYEEIFLTSKKCPYYIAKEHLTSQWYSLVVPKESLYLPAFDKVIRRLMEGGFIDYWYQRSIFPTLDRCSKREMYPTDRRMNVMKLSDMQGPLFALFLGAIVSTACLIGEILTSKKKIKSDGKLFLQPPKRGMITKKKKMKSNKAIIFHPIKRRMDIMKHKY